MHPRQFALGFGRVVSLFTIVLMFAGTTFATTEKVVYSFQDNPDGRSPQASLVADSAGNFYGTTLFGGDADFGTVFELSPRHRWRRMD